MHEIGRSSATGPDGLRVLNVCETAKGGIATYLNLLWKIRAPGQSWRFIVQDSHQSQLAEDMPVTSFKASSRRALNPLRLMVSTYRELRSFRPDIVFFHSTFTLPVMAMLRLLRIRARFVYCAHGWAAGRYPSSSWKHRVVKLVERHLVGLSDVVVNISNSDRNFAREAGYSGTHVVIENAVEDLPQATIVPPSRKDNDIRLLFVGRFDHQKGLDILLAAFRNALRKRSDMTLSVVGDTVLGDSLPAFEHTDRVTFHGWVNNDEIAQYYGNADLLAVPSRWEGFGLIVPEAMRSGTPALVSDRGNLPHIVEPGRTGLVVSLSVEEWTDALVMLDKTQLAEMRPNCVAMFRRRFHQDRFGKEVQVLFRDLLAGNDPALSVVK